MFLMAQRRLFLTATPRIFGKRRKNAIDDEDIPLLASMDDASLYGPVVYRLSPAEAAPPPRRRHR